MKKRWIDYQEERSQEFQCPSEYIADSNDSTTLKIGKLRKVLRVGL